MEIAMTAAMETGQLSGVRGPAGRGGRTVAGDQGFTQVFLQMMNGAGSKETGQELLNQAGLMPEEEAGEEKESPWAMLMAALEVMPQNPDLGRPDLVDGSGEMAAVLNALEALGPLASPDQAKEAASAAIISEANLLNNPLSGQQEAMGDPVLQALIQEAVAASSAAAKAQGSIKGAGTNQPAVDAGGKESFLTGTGQEGEHEPVALAGSKGIAATVIGYEEESSQGAAGERLFLGRQQFSQAVEEAKSKLAGKGSESIPEASIGNEGIFKTLVGNLESAAAEPLPTEEMDISQQIFTGLSKNLAAQKSEFVIKLMPEGLGEVTVKLLEKEGKTTLRIITASSETARLINNDINALRDALRPIQVEVHEAIPEAKPDSEAASYQQQFAQFGQFNQFGRQGNQGESPGGTQWQSAGEEGREEASAHWPAAAPESDLDLYV